MAHAIGSLGFALWEGEPPSLPIQHVARFTRPGVNGVGMQHAGFWGDPFDAVLTSYFANFNLAVVASAQYRNLVGAGVVPIMYNFVQYLPVFGVVATVDYYQSIEVKAGTIVGPGFFFPMGGIAVGRFTMTLHQI